MLKSNYFELWIHPETEPETTLFAYRPYCGKSIEKSERKIQFNRYQKAVNCVEINVVFKTKYSSSFIRSLVHSD